MPPRFSICLLSGILFFLCGSPVELAAQLPPAPYLPEIGKELREKALSDLESDNYFVRQSAQKLLSQGGAETVNEMLSFFKQASTEAKVRGLQVVLQINLELLRKQMDDQALEVSETIDEIRLIDNDLLGHRLDEFNTIHYSQHERAAARALTRLNAMIEYNSAMRRYPGINSEGFTVEIPQNIFIGSNWSGTNDDLRHIAVLLKYGGSSVGRRFLYRIKGCPIPLSYLQDLAAGLPGVGTGERSRARLGISTSLGGFQTTKGWTIGSVLPGSAMALAGVQQGETVVRTETVVINTFDDLVKSLDPYEPGDRVKFDIFNNKTPSKEIELTVPEKMEKLGIEIDDKFENFALIKSVKKDSVAAQAKLTNLYCIDRVNDIPIFNARRFQLVMAEFSPGDEIILTVRPLRRVTVRLRGWVGAYR